MVIIIPLYHLALLGNQKYWTTDEPVKNKKTMFSKQFRINIIAVHTEPWPPD